jgi:hypothetical protein
MGKAKCEEPCWSKETKTHDVSISSQEDCLGSTSEVGKAQGRKEGGLEQTWLLSVMSRCRKLGEISGVPRRPNRRRLVERRRTVS